MQEIRRSNADRWFDSFNYGILALALLVVLYPLYFILISSISDPDSVNAGNVWLWPRNISFEGYNRIFADVSIWTGYRNTVLYTLVGTVINVSLTITSGYALSRKLPGRTLFTLFILFSMFFSGGIIPLYLLVKSLGMINTMWALVIPNAVSAFYVIIARTFFQTSLPEELIESAQIDGCSNTRYFLSIAIPLSKPILVVLILFSAVTHWNSYFQALIYLRDKEMYPLQIILRDILIQSQVQQDMMTDADSMAALARIVGLIKYGMVVVATLPILAVYPFFQNYFVKGVMLGSVKG